MTPCPRDITGSSSRLNTTSLRLSPTTGACVGRAVALAEARTPADGLAALDAIGAKHPLGLGSADDVAGAYSYLASDASAWTTGTALVVDGGYAAP